MTTPQSDSDRWSTAQSHDGEDFYEIAVNTKKDLITLLTRLAESSNQDPDSWENHTLGRFFEAAAAWLDGFPQSYINNAQPVPTPDWRFIADLLLAAKIYE